MVLDFDKINRDIFLVRPGTVAGETVHLVEPHYSGGSEKWTPETLHFRSSMWNSEGKLISAGFPKFFNLFIAEDGMLQSEHALAPIPKSLKGWQLMDKIDGSLLILSKYKGELIIRTRGTFNYKILGNAEEMDYLRATYPKVFAFFDNVETADLSLLFEWYSPKNTIVINYGDTPKLWLIGGIYHNFYHLFDQSSLDMLAGLLQVGRPEAYKLDSIEDAKQAVTDMVGREGFVMYGPYGPVKIKSPRYWALHAMKEGVSSLEKVLDLWLGIPNPTYNSVFKFIEEQYSFESAEFARHFISKIADANKEVNNIILGFLSFLNKNGLATKSDKDAYAIISAAYGKTNRAGYVMKLKKGGAISTEGIKKLFLQVLKK